MDRVKAIIDLDLKTFINEGRSLITAYCYCLSSQEVVELLLRVYRSRIDFRDIALRKVREDISINFEECHKHLATKLLREFDSLTTKERQSAGYCLSSLVEVLPAPNRKKIQQFFIQSKYIGIRRRGYKSLLREKRIPVTAVGKAWNKFRDPKCAWLIVNKFPTHYLIGNRCSLLESLEEGWQKSRLFINIGSEFPEVVDELRVLDPISYCYVLVKLGLTLSEVEAKQIFDESMTDERLGLLIWAFGRLRLWGALNYIKAKFPDIVQQRNQTIIERHKNKRKVKGPEPIPSSGACLPVGRGKHNY